MDMTACVSSTCNQRYSCLRYMGKRGQRQSYSDLQLHCGCDKIELDAYPYACMTREEADAHNAPLYEDFFNEAVDNMP